MFGSRFLQISTLRMSIGSSYARHSDVSFEVRGKQRDVESDPSYPPYPTLLHLRHRPLFLRGTSTCLSHISTLLTYPLPYRRLERELTHIF